MFAIIGGVVVIGCVIGGYVAMGGHLEVLIQPFELVIIGGGALGAFITSNPIWVVKKCFGSIGTVIKGSKHNKESYLELLGLQYTLFKLLKSKGPMVLEQHLEHPEDSALFQQYPKFHADHHAVHFLDPGDAFHFVVEDRAQHFGGQQIVLQAVGDFPHRAEKRCAIAEQVGQYF